MLPSAFEFTQRPPTPPALRRPPSSCVPFGRTRVQVDAATRALGSGGKQYARGKTRGGRENKQSPKLEGDEWEWEGEGGRGRRGESGTEGMMDRKHETSCSVTKTT